MSGKAYAEEVKAYLSVSKLRTQVTREPVSNQVWPLHASMARRTTAQYGGLNMPFAAAHSDK